uniref:BED-type domain-containing protein n=1 Tax=Trichogramma kaykai TaxID=54128 RepID=A0ABD2W4S2_9HYME
MSSKASKSGKSKSSKSGKGWLIKRPSGDAWCKVCSKGFRRHATDLKKHVLCPLHTNKMESIDSIKQKSITSFGNRSSTKDDILRDMKIATFVACHTALLTMDHLCDLLKNNIPSIGVEYMKRLEDVPLRKEERDYVKDS